MPVDAQDPALCLLPVGAEPIDARVTRFRVWAPDHRAVTLVLESAHSAGETTELGLTPEPGGYFSIEAEAPAGTRYRYRLGDLPQLLPDPASRYQPLGPEGPSVVINARKFGWTDRSWRGVQPLGHVIYEIHIGTFTHEGSWRAAAEQLPELARLGITLLEIMPIAEFPGNFGWSYDGVNQFAPSHLYGTPDDMRRFVDIAHSLGIGVTLDLVYNHFGITQCHMQEFAKAYASTRHKNEWGGAVNFDGDDSGPVREFFLANIRHWVSEYHLDGVRIDATQAFNDESPQHILGALVREARAAASARSIIVIAESEPQDARMLQSPERGGFGMDMVWNDDFHHSAMVRATGRNEAYYTDYLGRAREFVAAIEWGYLYQGQRYKWQQKRRGSPVLDQPAHVFVNYLQNHDQLANSGRGQRLHELTSPGKLRALTATLLLGPGTPLLFQGQEFASSSPFLYFADPGPEIAPSVTKGRLKFLSQFPSLALPELQRSIPEPSDSATFTRCRLNFAERHTNAQTYRLHADLLRLRRNDACLRLQDKRSLAAAVINDDCFLVRYFNTDAQQESATQRLLIVNFGRELHLDPAPEPLLAPPEDQWWSVLWSSEDLCYGGLGTPALETDDNWRVPAECAVLMQPIQSDDT